MAKRSSNLTKRSSGRQLKACGGAQRTHPIKDPQLRQDFIAWFYLRAKKAKTELKKDQAKRDLMIILTAMNTAFRAEDLLQLRVKDIDKGFMSVKENKTGKIQCFPINRDLWAKLMDYVKENGLSGDEYIFNPQQLHSKGLPYTDPVTRQRINQIINKAVHDVGIPYSVGLHGLRKTFGYAFVKESGGNPLTLMKMYNHSNMSVTQRYVEWDIDDVQKERENIFIDYKADKKKRK
jgi:integrase